MSLRAEKNKLTEKKRNQADIILTYFKQISSVFYCQFWRYISLFIFLTKYLSTKIVEGYIICEWYWQSFILKRSVCHEQPMLWNLMFWQNRIWSGYGAEELRSSFV